LIAPLTTPNQSLFTHRVGFPTVPQIEIAAIKGFCDRLARTDYTILLAEANREAAQAIQTTLRKAGLDAPVHWINNYEAVIKYLEEKRNDGPLISVLLLDAYLPNKDGFEVLRWIASQRKMRRLQIVMLVMENDRVAVDKAYQMGANSFLTKPIKPKDAQNFVEFLNGYWSMTGPMLNED
jgi:CheY-like chemotaxis protein